MNTPPQSTDTPATPAPEGFLRYDEPPAGPRVRHARRHLPPTLLTEPRVIAAIHQIEVDLAQTHSLDALAEGCGLSPFHFHRLFADVMGETVGGFIRRQRLDVAAIRLAASELPVMDSSAMFGLIRPDV